ncbi:hypothetical protein [Paraburkholderia sp. RL17-337-BIB-A]|uniref:hypothetical protein n=1 Tax=Paraburkholderia sp. RL17-337-BIB-A TaxID=3031636 RepID=UPI0038BDEEEF
MSRVAERTRKYRRFGGRQQGALADFVSTAFNQRNDAQTHRTGTPVCLRRGRRPPAYQIHPADTAGRQQSSPGAQTRLHGGVLWRPRLDVRAWSVS